MRGRCKVETHGVRREKCCFAFGSEEVWPKKEQRERCYIKERAVEGWMGNGDVLTIVTWYTKISNDGTPPLMNVLNETIVFFFFLLVVFLLLAD